MKEKTENKNFWRDDQRLHIMIVKFCEGPTCLVQILLRILAGYGGWVPYRLHDDEGVTRIYIIHVKPQLVQVLDTSKYPHRFNISISM